MPKEKDTMRTRIENIKGNLQSTATCTTATVAELKALLTGDGEQTQKENVRARATSTVRAQSSTRKRAGTGAAANAEDSANKTGGLATRERCILATEVVNITLKSLTEAVKTQTPSRTAQPSSKSKPPTTSEAAKPQRPRTAQSNTAPVPLKERSASQIHNSPIKKPSLRRSSSYSTIHTTGPDPGLLATAECARLAFLYLSTPEATKSAYQGAAPELVLENGRLALVGKLVALGLDNLAVKEMRTLKKRLDAYNGRPVNSEQSRPASSRAPSRQATTAEKESLATLLDFGDGDLKSAAIPIITNLQIYALRIFGRVRRPRIVEEAYNYLKLSHPSNPADLILQAAVSPEQQARASRQLESLAQTIIQLCPSIATASDEEQLQPASDAVLRLQYLAFKIRQKWWALAKHRGDNQKELVDPFSKCLVTFARRSKLPAAEKYRLAESLYTDLLHIDGKSGVKNSTLASLARECQLSDQALRWLGASAPSQSDKGTTSSTTRAVRVAAVSLEAMLKDVSNANPDVKIDTALESLSGSIDGSTKELETLMAEVNALRRAATRLLLSSSSADVSPLSPELEQQCIRVVAASLHFAIRFVGGRPPEDAHAKALASYQARFTLASKLTKSFCDSVLTCGRIKLTSEESWKEMDALIQDCVRFISEFEGENNPTSAIQDPKFMPFVKLSNVYWNLHAQLRKLNSDGLSAAAALQRSAQLLESRSQTEQSQGQLISKLERLGETLDELDRIEESRDAFQRCMNASLSDDLIAEIVQETSKRPISHIFDGNRSLYTFSRTLKLYHRSFVKHGIKISNELAFYDNDAHPAAVRGAVLELQLSLFQQTLSKNRTWNGDLNSSIQAIADRLRDVYDQDQFPVRRLRTCLLLLQLLRTYPGIISEVNETPQKVIENLEKTEDCDLVRFLEPMKALYTLQAALQDAELTKETLEGCFGIWYSMLGSATSWDEVVGRLDNVDYWHQAIQASIDLLCAKGEEYAALPVLHLQVRMLELQKCPDPSQLLMALCSLGLQLLRLGYSGKAGLAFAKAEILASNGAASTEARLRWHLAYAEYMLIIGNTKKRYVGPVPFFDASLTSTSESTLAAAEALAKSDPEFMDLAKSSTTLSGRMTFYRVVTDACYVSSLLCSSKGDYKNAARYARQSVTLNRRIWSALEGNNSARQAALPDSSNSSVEGASGFEPLTSMRDAKGAPLAVSMTHDALKGPDFWSLVPSLYRTIMQHSTIYVSQGLLEEAVYIAEQATKVASAVDSWTLLVANASRIAELWIQSGKPDKAAPLLEAQDVTQCGPHLSTVSYHLSVARLHHAGKDFENEIAAYSDVEKLLKDLSSPTYFPSIEGFSSSTDTLAKDMSALTLESPQAVEVKPTRKGRTPAAKAAPKTPAKTTRTAAKTTRQAPLKSAPRTASRAPKKAAMPQAVEEQSTSTQCASLTALQSDVIYRRIATYLLQDDIVKAVEELGKIEALDQDRDGSHAWVRFKAMLAQAISSISEDFTFNTLPESTIAFPAVPTKDRQSSEGVATTKRPAAKSVARGARGKQQAQQVKDDFAELIQNAREKLAEAHSRHATAASNHIFRQLSAALSQATVLLSAVSRGRFRGSIHPLYSAYMSGKKILLDFLSAY